MFMYIHIHMYMYAFVILCTLLSTSIHTISWFWLFPPPFRRLGQRFTNAWWVCFLLGSKKKKWQWNHMNGYWVGIDKMPRDEAHKILHMTICTSYVDQYWRALGHHKEITSNLKAAGKQTQWQTLGISWGGKVLRCSSCTFFFCV